MQAAEERAALAETVIREEVSADMGDLLREMEATYKVGSCVSASASAKWRSILLSLQPSYLCLLFSLVSLLKIVLYPNRILLYMSRRTPNIRAHKASLQEGVPMLKALLACWGRMPLGISTLRQPHTSPWPSTSGFAWSRSHFQKPLAGISPPLGCSSAKPMP